MRKQKDAKRTGLAALCCAGLLLLGGLAAWRAVSAPSAAQAVSAETEGEETELPVIMYHHVLGEDSSLLGDYVISLSEFESDLAWLKAAGYQAVSAQQLIDYTQGLGELPERPVLLTFDDGYESFYANAYPLLEKYQMKAVVSVIGRYSDLYSQPDAVKHLNYSHLNWRQTRELSESELVEIGNHSQDMHDATGKESRSGAKRRKGEGLEQYRADFRRDTETAEQKIQQAIGQKPAVYAYPFGYYTQDSEAILKEMGYQMTLSCESRVNTIRRDPECLYLLGRFNRPHGQRAEDFFSNICLNRAPLGQKLA